MSEFAYKFDVFGQISWTGSQDPAEMSKFAHGGDTADYPVTRGQTFSPPPPVVGASAQTARSSSSDEVRRVLLEPRVRALKHTDTLTQ